MLGKKPAKKVVAKKAVAKKAPAKVAKKVVAKQAVKKAAPKKAVKKAAPKKAVKKAAPKKAAKKAAPKKAPKKKIPRKPNPSFMRPVTPSAALAAIVGNVPLPRTEITKKVWEYIKRHGLQDTVNRRNINPDDKLGAVLGGKRSISMFDMTRLVNNNVS